MKTKEATTAEQLVALGFKLGGSRRMAEKYPDAVKVTEDTDWDFYGESNAINRKAIIDLGFERVDANDRSYWDDLLEDIYLHPDLNVQVLLRTHLDIYTAVFEGISARAYVCNLWKSSPVRDPDMCVGEFKGRVCNYFNERFREQGYQATDADLIF